MVGCQKLYVILVLQQASSVFQTYTVQLHLLRARRVATLQTKVIRLVKMVKLINDLLYTSNGK